MRQPDRRAPRYYRPYKQILSAEFINKFKEKYPQYAGYDTKLLIKFLKQHCVKITEVVVNTRDGVDLPEGMGSIFAAMVPIPKKQDRCIAPVQSMALGVKVRYTNLHTDGKLVKIVYCNYLTKYKYQGRALWGMTAVRPFKQLISSKAAEMHTKYIDMIYYKRVWEAIVNHTEKFNRTNETKKTLETYNEFE